MHACETMLNDRWAWSNERCITWRATQVLRWVGAAVGEGEGKVGRGKEVGALSVIKGGVAQ